MAVEDEGMEKINLNNLSKNEEVEKENVITPIRKGGMPLLFERSTGKWWNPRLDSKILEKLCTKCCLAQSRYYFVQALIYVSLLCIAWVIYFATKKNAAGIAWSATIVLLCVVLALLLTKSMRIYRRYSTLLAILINIIFIVSIFFASYFAVVTKTGTFFMSAEFLILLYTVMPLPVYMNLLLGMGFSVTYLIACYLGDYNMGERDGLLWGLVIGDVLLQFIIHLIGCQICLNLQVRRRSVFWKVAHTVQSVKELKKEQNMRKIMINSIMPKKVLDNLIFGEDNGMFSAKKSNQEQFRKLHLGQMDSVSILYADIVGFTKMSANKTAATLVRLLNDLFGRFDALCLDVECEKISTLGDCYYCVSGCPEANANHAQNCVRMGLGMIRAIRLFCLKNNVDVNMRIGIHTGKVLCGMLGTKKNKFDVWSNDVTLANLMEQAGVPGRIHISEATKDSLESSYEVEDGHGEDRAPVLLEKEITTYLIIPPDGFDELLENDAKEFHAKYSVNNNTGATQDGATVTNERAHNSPLTANNKVSNADNGEPKGNGILTQTSSQRHPLISKCGNDSMTDSTQSNEETSADMKPDQIWGFLGKHSLVPITDPNALSRLRHEKDKELVQLVQEEKLMTEIFFNKECLNPISLMFNEASWEVNYRSNFLQQVMEGNEITSFVSARFNFFLDVLVNAVIFLLIFLSSMAYLGTQTTNIAWIIYFVVFFTIQLMAVTVCGRYVFRVDQRQSCASQIIQSLAGWLPRHLFGSILLLSSAGLVFTQMWCRDATATFPLAPLPCEYFLILIGGCLVQLLTFNQLTSWLRFLIAIMISATCLSLLNTDPCGGGRGLCTDNTTEYILDIIMLLVCIFFANREYEISFRLTYYCGERAHMNKKKIEEERNEIDEIIQNIIPPHVTEVLMEKRSYSQNHDNVGVVFATIVNFNEFYEEKYNDGTECIRLLNEIIGDVDALLGDEDYSDIEKIKTIGTTIMVASGLNPNIRRDDNDPNAHLRSLMKFCIAMQDIIDDINTNMICFNFVLRIGFNHGAVTAGVIGTTKLLYDIWGDTVNTASRMDSTGMDGRIQVSEASHDALNKEEEFNFAYRGKIRVKGKGEMDTYLYVRPDEADRVIKPNPQPKVPFEGCNS